MVERDNELMRQWHRAVIENHSTTDASNRAQLVGRWSSDPEDLASIREFGQTTIEFRDDGSLIYTIHLEDGDQIIILTFKVEGKEIVTNQPSAPNEERSSFSFTDDGKLLLEFARSTGTYIRVK